jgi:hypothetical protein
MFRSRQSRPHPQLPSASVQYPSVPATSSRHLPRSARHSSTRALASTLPPVPSHESSITKSFRIRTSEKHAPNPFRIRTSKTQHLKPFRMNTYEKTPQGGPPGSSRPGTMRQASPRSTFNFRLSAVSSRLQPKGGLTKRNPSKNDKMDWYSGGDSVSTEAVAARRHAGTHLPVTWWKLEMPITIWHLLLN